MLSDGQHNEQTHGVLGSITIQQLFLVAAGLCGLERAARPLRASFPTVSSHSSTVMRAKVVQSCAMVVVGVDCQLDRSRIATEISLWA